MLVGAMNNPGVALEVELERIASAGFDFVDLTLEPPHTWPPDVPRIERLLAATGLGVVGHTAPYLPHASPFDELREQARAVLVRAFEAVAALGADRVNVHPSPLPSVYTRAESIARNAEALSALAGAAERAGVGLMVENFGRTFATVAELEPLFAAAASLRFHLDVGHANLGPPNRTHELVTAFADRLAHVHVHDNDGVDDLHLPLGAGTVPWRDVVAALRRAGYDGTVTVEVVDPAAVGASRQRWLELWAER